MDLYTSECMHYTYDFGQPCLILLTSCTRITYDNYNTSRINETRVNNYFTTIILDFYATT